MKKILLLLLTLTLTCSYSQQPSCGVLTDTSKISELINTKGKWYMTGEVANNQSSQTRETIIKRAKKSSFSNVKFERSTKAKHTEIRFFGLNDSTSINEFTCIVKGVFKLKKHRPAAILFYESKDEIIISQVTDGPNTVTSSMFVLKNLHHCIYVE